MEFLGALSQLFLTEGVPIWALLSVAGLAFYYVFFKEVNSSSLADRKQFYENQRVFIDNLQEQLDREREFGKQATHRMDQLANDIAYLKGQNQVLSKHIQMFVACPKADCPFRDVRKTLS